MADNKDIILEQAGGEAADKKAAAKKSSDKKTAAKKGTARKAGTKAGEKRRLIKKLLTEPAKRRREIRTAI